MSEGHLTDSCPIVACRVRVADDGLLILDVGAQNFQNIFQSANLGQNPTINLKTAKPISIPFDVTSSLGILILIGMLCRRSWLASKQVKARRQPILSANTIATSNADAHTEY